MKSKTCLTLVVVAFTALSAHLALADSGALHQAKQSPPIQLGTSGGSAADSSKAFCCGGTLGSLVLYDGALHILSNNHILARSGSATPGENTIQPGLIDVGCRASGATVVGTFVGDLVPLGSANVDTALSLANGAVDPNGSILDIGQICSDVQTPTVGLAVKKSGRTTGLTTGSILSINTSVSIRYQKGCNAGKQFTVSYHDQIVTGAMSAGGDSGSLLVSDDDGTPNPVGLLYAGSSSTTIYNPIQDVVNAYSAGGHTFSFVGNNCGTLTTASTASVALSPSVTSLRQVQQAKVENEHALMARPDVWGVGIGASEKDPTEAVIIVLLESPAHVVPGSIPDQVDGTKVRVIFTDPIVAQ